MKNCYIPNFVLEPEDYSLLDSEKINYDKGIIKINEFKIPCTKFFNLSIDEVFDILEGKSNLNEANNSSIGDRTYASRVMSILFLRMREVVNIKDRELRLTAACSLIAGVNSLYTIDPGYGRRLLPLLRSIA